ncbi:hypothetical protein L207DRAFT_592488 [Hyaloscypha variabilis F]|uniref:Uncharacterized protein n=1 Tax=Hyaloscypha variabilis (strain UAMH 11265 / GT02V1 / F) TaxID=1149755 RepID=A0A2J6QVT3_HYAVF|nr:hypothetical protein L207DRAFT_592488 [Hyaloscypha variabilis F]
MRHSSRLCSPLLFAFTLEVTLACFASVLSPLLEDLNSPLRFNLLSTPPQPQKLPKAPTSFASSEPRKLILPSTNVQSQRLILPASPPYLFFCTSTTMVNTRKGTYESAANMPKKVAKKSKTNATSARPVRVWPAPTHGRPTPYVATPQSRDNMCDAFPGKRGNPPGGIDAKVWDNAFNRAHTALYKLTKKSLRKAVIKAALEDGRIRDSAVEELIQKGVLPEDFVDANP